MAIIVSVCMLTRGTSSDDSVGEALPKFVTVLDTAVDATGGIPTLTETGVNWKSHLVDRQGRCWKVFIEQGDSIQSNCNLIGFVLHDTALLCQIEDRLCLLSLDAIRQADHVVPAE